MHGYSSRLRDDRASIGRAETEYRSVTQDVSRGCLVVQFSTLLLRLNHPVQVVSFGAESRREQTVTTVCYMVETESTALTLPWSNDPGKDQRVWERNGNVFLRKTNSLSRIHCSFASPSNFPISHILFPNPRFRGSSSPGVEAVMCRIIRYQYCIPVSDPPFKTPEEKVKYCAEFDEMVSWHKKGMHGAEVQARNHLRGRLWTSW